VREEVKTALQVAGELLPDLIDWIQAMRSAGASDDDLRVDIRSRTAEVKANRTERDAEATDKFGERPATGSHAVPPRGALDSDPPEPA